MTKISFTKMQGLGNDFVILDYQQYQKSESKMDILAKKLCDRHFGIGADGLIIVNPDSKNSDISWFFYNSDGTVAQMCGNGIRCFSKYVYDKGFVNKKEFSVDTLAGKIIPKINDDGTVTVNMNKPVLVPSKIPIIQDKILNFPITACNETFNANATGMGNPHCVIFTDKDTKMAAEKYGYEIEHNKIFPEKTNVEFVKIISPSQINLDVWERGCGITLACGTGACASVCAGILNGVLQNNVTVNLPGGQLNISWQGKLNDTDYDIFMTGSANYVFTGMIDV